MCSSSAWRRAFPQRDEQILRSRSGRGTPSCIRWHHPCQKELYISNSVTRMLYGRTQRNEPSRFLREIEPEYIEETRSPVLEQRSHMGGWGSEYSDTVPGGASGYSGPSGYSRSSYGGGYGSSYSSGNRSGYLNREYNAGESRGFGSSYGGRNPASSGLAVTMATAPPSRPQEAADLAPHIPAEMRQKIL